jgi:uncharacterized protein
MSRFSRRVYASGTPGRWSVTRATRNIFIETLKKILLRFFIIAAIVYIALCGWLYVKQRSLLYFPTPAAADADVQAQTFELQSDGLLLKGWVINPGKQRALIYFGGNGEAVEYSGEVFKKTLPNVSVYLLPYRSYSGNPGEVTEANLYNDALKLHDKIKTHHSSVSAMGRSLGTGIATYLASQRKIDKLILVTPYDSIVNVAQEKYPIFPVGLLLEDRYESWRRAKVIQSNVLVMIAGMDEIIPRANTENLLRHFKQKPKVIVFENAGHNTPSDSSEYDRAVSEFIGR